METILVLQSRDTSKHEELAWMNKTNWLIFLSVGMYVTQTAKTRTEIQETFETLSTDTGNFWNTIY